MYRELDDALVRLRFNHPNIGLVIVKTKGDAAKVLELDAQLLANQDKWYVKETLLLMKRVLKRLQFHSRDRAAARDAEARPISSTEASSACSPAPRA